LWLLTMMMALWVNLHGGFLFGLLLGGVYLAADALRWLGGQGEAAEQAARRLRTLAPIGAVTLVATQLNPAGPVLFEYLAGFFQKSLILNRTSEWKSPDFHLAE